MDMEVKEEPSTDELDHLPLIVRRRLLLSGNALVTAVENRFSTEKDVKSVKLAGFQEWPGLPRGMRFDPTDGDLLWHLIAKNGNENDNRTPLPHPFIHEYINSLEGVEGFEFDKHPQNLRGVKQDGTASYFFHRPAEEHYDTCQNPIGWKQIEKPTPVFLDGTHQGFRKDYNFFKPEKTNWVLHQYRAGTDERETDVRKEELVVSKLFYSLKSKKVPTDERETDVHDDVIETITRQEGEANDNVEDPNQGQYGNLVDIKTEPVTETSALKVAPALRSCIVKSEQVDEKLPLNAMESESRVTRIPLLGYSQSSENVNNDSGYTSLRPKKKKKKTATDSAEHALEEDAPGLLKVLTDKGIIMGEIKLYGVGEDDTEPLDISSESDFGDLENIISKLFPERASLHKINTAKHIKAAKPVYCLSCLISLIEQTRYLQFRKSSVEWGWCRDLQSFIFVFQSHNRIVLERPEYGFATYFFELVPSMPIDWQIRRLVTAMKVNTSRASLIENKPLLVGVDVSEGEARVLEGYGWVKNTGIGTMLNYCDRVVHDRWHETNNSEWRVKIGQILMNGYNRGSVVLTNLPSKVRKYLSDDVDSSSNMVKTEYEREF